ncbi:hypothetical protein MANES_14G035000v8 [Manihot esculenta]|uniref:Uncharacterized protein n=1 Tax=Manihot esculenta TaxID=3983 RepID=A0ACB7GDT4_MANES|nr:hypothetical protein MANES_14G035000v8 [Manihot esculenta]
MQQRKTGRPSGTDGSDFSYRMVVDSRYTKVAKGKSRLYALILAQAAIQLIGLLYIVLSISKETSLNTLAISSPIIGLISLLIGELGRRRSRVSFLRVYIIMSSIAILISLTFAITSNSSLQVIWTLSNLERKKFEFIETILLVLGLIVHIVTVGTVISLIGQMMCFSFWPPAACLCWMTSQETLGFWYSSLCHSLLLVFWLSWSWIPLHESCDSFLGCFGG